MRLLREGGERGDKPKAEEGRMAEGRLERARSLRIHLETKSNRRSFDSSPLCADSLRMTFDI